jgi:hypothetical protein
MAAQWRYVRSSVVGSSHIQNNMPCQDASACTTTTTSEGEHVLVAVVSDGAGSAQHAEFGSQFACTLLIDSAIQHIRSGCPLRDINRDWVREWLLYLQHEMTALANAEGTSLRDYSCTIAAAMVAEDMAVFFQVGDGVIVVSSHSEPNEYSWMFWPHHGEYVNETMFATDRRALDTFDFDLVENRIEEVALLTDGLERLALHLESQTAYRPFFEPFFTTMRSAPKGFSEELSGQLGAFLSTPRFDERTNDDRTLLLATRLDLEEVIPAGSVSESGNESGELLL